MAKAGEGCGMTINDDESTISKTPAERGLRNHVARRDQRWTETVAPFSADGAMMMRRAGDVFVRCT